MPIALHTIVYNPDTERYAVLDAANHEMTTFEIEPADGRTAAEEYAVTVSHIFRKMAMGEL